MNRLVTVLLLLGFALAAHAQETKVYKTVNPDGSVTYTDQRPAEGEAGQEVDLPELQVVEPRAVTSTLRDARRRANRSEPAPPPYQDFQMVEPQPDQTYWGTGGTLTVRLATSDQLEEDHTVRYYYDGQLAGTSPSLTQILTEVYRGQHTIRAEIVDARGRVQAAVGPVTFHMKQHSVQHPNRNRSGG